MTYCESGAGYGYYEYNEKGLRTKKDWYGSPNITSSYYYDGDRLVTEVRNSDRLDFLYDEAGLLYGFILNNTSKYFYVRDILQNILGIIDESGTLVVKYDYNAFGKILSVTDTSGLSIGELNPFRYKGYYYDSEIEMYYCKARYYSPILCRFIQPDDINYLNPKNINELNLFSYCKNNPITLCDLEGTYHESAIINNLLQRKSFILKLVDDFKNLNFNNDSEEVVINSNYFSYYKGSLVIRHSIPNITSCGVFNMIFLNRNVDDVNYIDAINTVKHEWGHNQQEKILGTPLYLLRIGIPSAIGCYFGDTDDSYYSQYWEHSADILGGVNREGYNYTTSAKESLFYLYTGLSYAQFKSIFLEPLIL